MRADLEAIWLVRSRAVWSDLGFWLILLGYNPRERSISNPLYFIYAMLFFALWIFMVLILLADFAANLLKGLPFGTLESAAVGVGALGFSALFLYELYRATQRSPFVFSEVDAHLLVQTPVDRRPVALGWLATAWLERGLGVWAVAVVLGYALMQAITPRDLTPADLPAFLVAGVRMFSVAVPLYLAVLALAWAVGAWRLRGSIERANLRWVAPAVVLLIGGSAAAFSVERVAGVLAPLNVLIRAGLGLAPWGVGLGLSWLAALICVGILWLAAKQMSLARAAQETRDREAIRAAALTLRFDLADELGTRQRLREGRKPSRLPAGPGIRALRWKSTLQAARNFKTQDALHWLAIAGLALSMIAYPAWGVRLWALILWVMFTAQWMITPLRKELARWWMFRQLPFTSGERVNNLLLLPLWGVWAAGAAALFAALLLGLTIPEDGVILYFLSAPAVGFAAAVDVLRRSKTQDMLVGRVPDLTIVTVLLGLLVLVINGGFTYVLVAYFGLTPLMALILVVIAAWTLIRILRDSAGNMLRKMG